MKKLFLVLLSLLLVSATVINIELFLRRIDYTYYPLHIQVLGATTFGDETVDKSDWRYFHIFKDKAFIYDPILIWKPSPHFQIDTDGDPKNFFNSLGYPGPLVSEDNPEKKYRIVALGDSNTLGLQLYDATTNREVSWPAYLERYLGTQFQVINAGVWGYSSYQMQQRFYESLAFQPSMVIISPSGNDGHQVGIPDKLYSTWGVALDRLLISYKLAQLFQANVDKAKSMLLPVDQKVLVPRVSLHDYEEILKDIVRESSKRSIKLVFMTRPHQEAFVPNYNAKPYNEAIRRIAIEYAIPLIDIDEKFKTRNELFLDGTHFNQAGLGEMAQFISEGISL